MSSRASIAVIGCGGVGARHLQSLARLTVPANVYAIDPSAEALGRAGALFEQWLPAAGEARPSLTLLTDASGGLPSDLDVAVVATRAQHRLPALEALLAVTRPRKLVLEKFLFARRADFSAGVDAVARSGAHSPVVNCPRRIYPGYRAIARHLTGARYVDLRVSASARTAPLGTIGIHFVDLLDFLCGGGHFRCASIEDGAVVDGNRGLQDFAGRLRATLEGVTAGRLSVDADASGKQPLWVTIDSDRGRFVINERDQKFQLSLVEEDWAWREEHFEVPLQSQLTGNVVESLLRGEDCGLTPLARSIELHLPLFDALIDCYRMNRDDRSLDEIPFT